MACILLIISVVILAIFISNRIKTPNLDGDWTEDALLLPQVTFEDNQIQISNIRDWRYQEGKVLSYSYYEDSFEKGSVTNLYLLLNPFGKWEGVGHSFLIFEFENGKTISVSIEARREKGQSYSAVKGLFNAYEIWYSIASPADHITRRALYYNEDIYKYSIRITKESMNLLFEDIMNTVHELETTPKFYNTISSNCTNLLVDSANRVKKGSIPLHYSRVFTGYTDNHLHTLGFIENKKSFEEVEQEARIDLYIKEMFYDAEYSNDDFWMLLKKR